VLSEETSRPVFQEGDVPNCEFFSCPCFQIIDEEPCCINGAQMEPVEEVFVDPGFWCATKTSENAVPEKPICCRAVLLDIEGNQVICLSQGVPIAIRGTPLRCAEFREVLDLFPADQYSSNMDICSECLYKLLASTLEQTKPQKS
jgi:hypothetical protein